MTMATARPDDERAILQAIYSEDDAVRARLWRDIYGQLRQLARACFSNQPDDHTLQPTALVHEVYVKLATGANVEIKDDKHLLALAARVMRQILVDHARSHATQRRGGGWARQSLELASSEDRAEIDIIALDEALATLEHLHERQARVVELRFLGGLTVEQTADVLDVSPRTVKLDWQMARAWLHEHLREEGQA
jgi:RNA polymerase sigma-70 factor (ECF subfamily)